ncbi:hypothetical protein [Mycobacterium sp. 1081908.1]|uniref:hypothetical protein n=1 Tax=Mycobacterium sp. 1081908.1 TaxID=1834066 RepID=UPI0007FE8249|nr:hypothetical protein [Mycobacterium sp. 1081908.1]OBK52365.1 hypothetical protein A5655_21820 [Mycobacterium sp. 1081908.1]
MSVQDDKETGQEEDQQATDQESGNENDRQQTEKPEPNEEHKEKAAEMMTAYEDRPTLVLPGSAAMVTGTAVNDWLDEDGNPKCETPDDAGSEDAGAKADSDPKEAGSDQKDDEGKDPEAHQEQIEKDKALNEELKKAAAEENKGEKRPTGS